MKGNTEVRKYFWKKEKRKNEESIEERRPSGFWWTTERFLPSHLASSSSRASQSWRRDAWVDRPGIVDPESKRWKAWWHRRSRPGWWAPTRGNILPPPSAFAAPEAHPLWAEGQFLSFLWLQKKKKKRKSRSEGETFFSFSSLALTYQSNSNELLSRSFQRSLGPSPIRGSRHSACRQIASHSQNFHPWSHSKTAAKKEEKNMESASDTLNSKKLLSIRPRGEGSSPSLLIFNSLRERGSFLSFQEILQNPLIL